MNAPALDPKYHTDEYPREGCTAVIDVLADRFALRIHAPDGRCFESYGAVTSRDEICRMVREWLDGKAPRLQSPESDSGS